MSIYDLPSDQPKDEDPKGKPAKSSKKPKTQSAQGSIYDAAPASSGGESAEVESSTEKPEVKPAPVKKPEAKAAAAAKPTGSVYGTTPQNVPVPAPARPAGAAASPGKKKRRLRGCGCTLGCLTILMLPVVLAVIGMGVVAWKWTDWTRDAVVAVVDESDLTDADKQAVIAEIDRIHQGYGSGEISLEQLIAVADQIRQSPLGSKLVAFAVHEKYVIPSGLPPDDKAVAWVTLQRVAHGVQKRRITPESLDAALDFISVQNLDGTREFFAMAFDDDVRAMLTECQKLADEARIPRIPPALDIGATLRQAVDQGLEQREQAIAASL